MPPANAAALEFLLTRRSRPAKTLSGPYPDRAALMPILRAAARSPDHGKLEPWRFVVLGRTALDRLGGLALRLGETQGRSPEDTERFADQFRRSGLAVAVIESPQASDKIPALEQTYSAGAACLALLNAALASGWGANWLSGWGAHDPDFAAAGLDVRAPERIVGFVHIGTPKATPPERPRPDLARIVRWELD